MSKTLKRPINVWLRWGGATLIAAVYGFRVVYEAKPELDNSSPISFYAEAQHWLNEKAYFLAIGLLIFTSIFAANFVGNTDE